MFKITKSNHCLRQSTCCETLTLHEREVGIHGVLPRMDDDSTSAYELGLVNRNGMKWNGMNRMK